jgi:antirestriction protein ArdC
MSNVNYQLVTDRLVSLLEQGVAPWRKPWDPTSPAITSGRPLRVGGQPYRGINTVSLWAAAQIKGYNSPYWMTYKAAQAFGAQVKKGERAEPAFFVGQSSRVTTDENTGEEGEESFSFLKSYAVFNAAQIEDLPDHYYVGVRATPVTFNHPETDQLIAASGAAVRHGGDKAFFSPSHDFIQMPPHAAFRGAEQYYGTLLHELVHYTSAPQRCDRQLGKRFGDNAYAAEELVAELGAAFLCADLGVATELPDHAAYLQSWLKMMRADNRALFRAAALAERAAGWLLERAEAAPAQPAAPAPAEPVTPAPAPAPAEPAPAPAPIGPKGPKGPGPKGGKRKPAAPAPAEPAPAPAPTPKARKVKLAPVAPAPAAVTDDPSWRAPAAEGGFKSAAFWNALGEAHSTYARSHDVPLPYAETPAGARTLRFVNHKGDAVTVKQPRTFKCPPARFWPGGTVAGGAVAPAAMVDESDADYAARLARSHDANVANLQRWVAAYLPHSPEYADPADLTLQVAQDVLRTVDTLSSHPIRAAIRMQAACVISARDLARARGNLAPKIAA